VTSAEAGGFLFGPTLKTHVVQTWDRFSLTNGS